MKQSNPGGFTLVEIMIVVAIIALLVSLILPNLVGIKLSANDALAQTTLRNLSKASETFAMTTSGSYPTNMTSLTGATPAYISEDACGTTAAGFTYLCTMTSQSYSFTATPVTIGTSGTTTYTVTTGGVLTP